MAAAFGYEWEMMVLITQAYTESIWPRNTKPLTFLENLRGFVFSGMPTDCLAGGACSFLLVIAHRDQVVANLA